MVVFLGVGWVFEVMMVFGVVCSPVFTTQQVHGQTPYLPKPLWVQLYM